MTALHPYSGLLINDDLGPSGSTRFMARRNRLLKAIDGPFIVSAVRRPPAAHAPWANLMVPVFQDPLFLYLTGLTQPGLCLLLDPSHPTHPETLFLPLKNPDHEFWEGTQLGADHAPDVAFIAEYTGIQHCESIESLSTHLTSLSQRHSQITTFWNQSPSGRVCRDDHYQFRHRLRRWLPSTVLTNAQSDVWSHMLCLDDVDIASMHCAQSKTLEAFTHTARQISQIRSETELAGLLVGELLRRTHFGLSFHPIVAGGQQATTLHYTQNNQPLVPGQLVLLDFGLRWHNMHSDISRVLPVNGRFNPLQALVYEAVLAGQAVVESAAKPGVTINELNTLCWSTIQDCLTETITRNGGTMTLRYSNQPHNVSHLIGYTVHDGDPFRAYRSHPLQPGMIISNEPGVYGYFDCTIAGVSYREWIGIRIEDDLLITPNGCENLSRDIPKSIADIEALVTSPINL